MTTLYPFARGEPAGAFTNSTGTVWPSGPLDVESLLANIRETKHRLNALPKPDFDVLVCVRSVYESLRRQFAVGGDLAPPAALWNLYGVEIHAADSEMEARARGLTMRADGLRVKVLLEG